MEAAHKTAAQRPEPPPCDGFARLLRRARERRGYTAAGLAAAMLMNPSYFTLWERKPGYPIKRTMLLRVCDFLGASDTERRRLLQLADDRLLEHTR